MRKKASVYPLPTKYYTENKVHEGTAHGTSMLGVEAAKLLGKPLKN